MSESDASCLRDCSILPRGLGRLDAGRSVPALGRALAFCIRGYFWVPQVPHMQMPPCNPTMVHADTGPDWHRGCARSKR
eukprot:scaffold25294_cov133-Isochrysis_galbana.AAC.2